MWFLISLAHDGRSLLGQPLQARRALLQELLAHLKQPRLQFSDGIVGPGQVFFEQAVRQGQEGVMAKHLASRYLPGKRSSCWLKIKPAAAFTLCRYRLGSLTSVAALRSVGGGLRRGGGQFALRGQRPHGV